jgi:hypothetical protein
MGLLFNFDVWCAFHVLVLNNNWCQVHAYSYNVTLDVFDLCRYLKVYNGLGNQYQIRAKLILNIGYTVLAYNYTNRRYMVV